MDEEAIDNSPNIGSEAKIDLFATTTPMQPSLIDEVAAFVFPVHSQHALSSARLILVALYGPLENGHIKGGRLLKRYLNPREIDIMCDQIENEDIVSIYASSLHGNSTSHAEQLDIIRQATLPFKTQKGKAKFPQLTREDFQRMFASSMDFTSFQRAALEYRAQRVSNSRRGEDIHAAPSNKRQLNTIAALNASTLRAGVHKQVSKLPSMKKLYTIMDVSQPQSNESLTSNIKVVRQSERDLLLDARPDILSREIGWSNTCYVKESGHGSFVDGRGSRDSPTRKFTIY